MRHPARSTGTARSTEAVGRQTIAKAGEDEPVWFPSSNGFHQLALWSLDPAVLRWVPRDLTRGGTYLGDAWRPGVTQDDRMSVLSDEIAYLRREGLDVPLLERAVGILDPHGTAREFMEAVMALACELQATTRDREATCRAVQRVSGGTRKPPA